MTPKPRRPAVTLLLLLAVCAAPFLLSWFLLTFTDVSRLATKHHGVLIGPPRPVEDFPLRALAAPLSPTSAAPASEPAAFSLHGKWSLVYLLDGDCARRCEENLYKMRQIRLATNKYAHRAQRVLIHTAAPAGLLDDRQRRDYRGQLGLSYDLLDRPAYRRLFQLRPQERPFSLHRLYLLDPQGNLMMMYAPETDPRGIIKDMTRLLKYSRSG